MYEFYDKTCNVWIEWTTRVRGSMQLSKTAVLTAEPCDFWTDTRTNRDDTNLARETDKDRYQVAMDISRKSIIKKWMILELIDQSWTSRGEFIIESTDIYELDNFCDCADYILLKVSNR